MRTGNRKLRDVISVGPAMLRDFELLRIRTVAQLAKQDARSLYEKLGRVTRQHHDICVLDTLAAIAQARHPRLPAEQCRWWWWSGRRKRGTALQTRV